MPAASSARPATFAISHTAQRKTVWPSWRRVGYSPSGSSPSCPEVSPSLSVWALASLSSSGVVAVGASFGASFGSSATAVVS